jgi:predicted nucleic acid-binding protein
VWKVRLACTREEHRKVHGLSAPEGDEVISSLVSVAESVQIRFLWRPLLSDPTDDVVLEAAVNGRADLLVPFNQADFAAAAKLLRSRAESEGRF